MYYRYYHDPGDHNTRAHYGVRTETHKLIYFWKKDQWECYNLVADPEEMHNIYDDPHAQKTVAMLKKEENRGRLAFFAGIDNCRFKRQVTPGDQLRLEVEMTRVRGAIGKGKGVATVEGEIACELEMTFALGPKRE